MPRTRSYFHFLRSGFGRRQEFQIQSAMNTRIFLSSTGLDLYAHRQAVSQAISLIDGAECIMMETFGPSNAPPVETCKEKVLSCNLFVGLIGFHFGEAPGDRTKSYTELEFEWSYDIEQLIWVAPSGAPLPNTDQTGSDLDRQRKFRERTISGPGAKTVVMDAPTWASPYSLANSVLIALFKQLRNPGYTEEQHRAKLKLREREIRAEINRASIQKFRAREAKLEEEAEEIRFKLRNIQTDFEATVQALAEARNQLAKLDNWVGRQQMRDALEALNLGDASLANGILAQVSQSWQDRMADPGREAARAEFELGKIAENQSNWRKAAHHFTNAADWDNKNYQYKMKLACSCVEIGDTSAALVYATQALSIAIRSKSAQEQEIINLLYDLAYVQSSARVEHTEILSHLQECSNRARNFHGHESIEYRYFLGRRAAFLSGKRLDRRPDRISRISS